MNILILTTHFNTGGITSYILSLSRGLVKKGHRVIVGSSFGNMTPELNQANIRHYCLDIYTKSEVSLKVYSSFFHIQKMLASWDIDIIHAQTRVTQVLGAIIHHVNKIPYVSTCHGFFKPRISRKIFPCWGQRVIAISESVQRHLIEDFGLSESQISCVTHGVESMNKQWDEERRNRRQEILKGVGGSSVILGTVARLSDVKGLDILIRSMPLIINAVRNVKLVIAGEGKEKISLQSLTKSLDLEKNIMFVPLVNQVDDILSSFDIFVMPSRQEGLGLSVLEALSRGLPVVASDVGGLKSLIRHQQTGLLVPAEDPRALAQAVIELIRNPNKAKAYGSAGRIFVKENFSLQTMIEKTISVYQEAINEKNSCC
jgi:glycosyltransferase involved in cell wall biosynthesis